ncbi:two pore domain potassium channel family protein [Rhodococcus spelaei]|uniref:Two pore domain potassium channel family protein n=1 Tax=Rhodococcus spelaei TaxID=2546320 RepID=A0A541B0R9_9NOCA|nr:potassium channel family protein [Rhodococcus spelaei]TQF65909.1 two pore domain potassium channel family protein [Rhodococcus spelaei]
MPADGLAGLSKADRNALIRRALVRPSCSAALLVLAYFLVPMRNLHSASAIGGLVLVLALVGALCGWQIWKIVHARYPALQAVEALALSLPAYLLAFATLYHVLSSVTPSSFSEPLSKLDALYFTLVCFSTVGFGDITAASETARAIVSVQIVANLALLAVGVRIITAAVKAGKRRRDSDD